MRPTELSALFASAEALKGIGPRFVVLLKKALRLPPGVTAPRVLDLLWHLPTGVIDRRAEPSVRDAVPGTIATLKVRVLKHRPSPRGNTKAPYKVACEDETGRLDLVFFHADPRFVERQLPVGEIRYVSGRVERYGETVQMAHPDYIVAPEQRDDLPFLEPVYPLTAGLSGKVLIKATRQAVERVPDLPEWQDAAWLKARGMAVAQGALKRLHLPVDAGGRLERRRAVAAAGLRRAAGQPAGAGAGARQLSRPARPARHRRRPHPRPHCRRAAVCADELAAHRAEGNRRRHGRAAAHAAPAARRRRLGQNGRRADGHGGRRGSRRASRADGADRSPGAPASWKRSSRWPRRPDCASRLLTGREKGKTAHRSCWNASPPARSTS